MVLSSADDFMCYECDARDPECKATNERDISQTACPTEKCLISVYQCNGTYISDDCQSEYDNAVQNGDLEYFYHRCATEGGATPLRTRCSLCCGEGGGCVTLRECAEEGIVSNDGVDTHIRVCEAGLCNDEELCNVEDCECNDSAASTTSPDDFMCYECDVRDSECKGTNGREISQTACPTEKCLISVYQCNDTYISPDCQSEYDNAVQNGNLEYFYHRCATEGGATPMRTRCSLCCGEGGGCVTVRECAEEGIVSIDWVDTHIRVCDAELCNDECEDCECNDSAASILSVSTALNLVMILKLSSNLLYP